MKEEIKKEIHKIIDSLNLNFSQKQVVGRVGMEKILWLYVPDFDSDERIPTQQWDFAVIDTEERLKTPEDIARKLFFRCINTSIKDGDTLNELKGSFWKRLKFLFNFL